MNIAEIWEKQKQLDEELDSGKCTEERTQEILKEMDKLEEIEKKAIERESKKIAKRLEKRHEAFCKRDYGPKSEPYYLLKWFANSNLDIICTDDIQYGDWEKEVPEEWVKKAKKSGNVKKALEKYFKVTGYIEELFNNLTGFQVPCDGHFPDHRLTILFEGKLLTLRLIEGQGSDFQIWKADAERIRDSNTAEIVLDYEDVLHLSKLNWYAQSLWYKDYLKKWYEGQNKKEPFNESLVLWILGVACAGKGFIRALNTINFEEEMRMWS